MTRRQLVILILRSALLLSIPCVGAYAQTDSLQLDSTVFSVSGRGHILEGGVGQVTRVEVAQLAVLPSVLGNSDPLHFTQMLPSMQTSSELDAGIHIQGCDHQHNLIALDGVPVYGVSHLMGLFSVFNPSHFKSMTYSTVAGQRNRLGGVIDMHTQASLPRKTEAEASLGLVSAQGTVKLPLGQKAAVLVSGRKSLVDLLYGDYMRFDDIPLSYDFGDVNVTAAWTASDNDRIWADFYFGDDALNAAKGGEYGMNLYWKNMLGSLHWTHGDLSQTLYYTTFALHTHFEQEDRSVQMPSDISTAGYRADWMHGALRLGADIAMHDILPQDPQISGSAVTYAGEARLRSFENSLTALYSGTLGYAFDWTAGLGLQWYLSPERKSYFGLAPQLSGTYYLPDAGRLQLRTGLWHQYLFQTGLSNLGFPTEFWLPAGQYSDPQWSAGASLAYDRDLHEGQLKLSGELYYRYLGHQLEYVGGLLEFLNGSYTLESALRRGSGQAFGLNLMLQKPSGRLTGWAGLSVGRSLRSFDGGTWPSNHERLVELDVVGSYSLGNWDFGATLVAAGGTPFTEPQEFFLFENQIVSVYRDHNSGRLLPYVRLDLNARLRLRDIGRVSHGLNFSVYNATARNQEVYRTVKVNREEGTYSYEHMYLGLTILPSVGYFMKF